MDSTNIMKEVTFRVENDFCNKSVIWDHHSEGSKQCFEVVWKLRSAGVTRIHGDESSTAGVQLQLPTLKHKLRKFLGFGVPDG